jgi:hypothetical protein
MIFGLIIFGVMAILGLGIQLRLRSRAPIAIEGLAGARIALLWFAGVLAAGMSFIGVATAVGVTIGMYRSFLDILLYLIPVLALPCFLILFVSLRALSRTVWLLTTVSALVFCLEWGAEKFANYDYSEAGFWVFHYVMPDLIVTVGYLPVSILVQSALLCQKRERMQLQTERTKAG